MRLPALATCLLLVFAAAPAQDPDALDALVERVRSEREAESQRLAEREARFIAERDQRMAMLEEVREQVAAAERRADTMRAEFEDNERRLSDLETQLNDSSGDLQELFSVVRQTAADAVPVIQNSLVSSQLPGRDEPLQRLVDKTAIPTVDELRGLWIALLAEMNQSGKTVRYPAEVITADGEQAPMTVTRVGTFTAVADGQYLRYLPETERLLALPQAPTAASLAAVRAFENGNGRLMDLVVDPTRGSILALLVQTPDFADRVKSGGIIAYIILGLGAIGLLIAIERFVVLVLAKRRIEKQGASAGGEGDGEISAIRRAAAELSDRESLAARLDELVAMARTRFDRGLTTLAIFGAVCPLLGLLGTVTGMIETFQVITLFGAGDPRLMSGGISQALITTQFGLAVAIPLILLHSFLKTRAGRLVALLDQESAEAYAGFGGRATPASSTPAAS